MPIDQKSVMKAELRLKGEGSWPTVMFFSLGVGNVRLAPIRSKEVVRQVVEVPAPATGHERFEATHIEFVEQEVLLVCEVAEIVLVLFAQIAHLI